MKRSNFTLKFHCDPLLLRLPGPETVLAPIDSAELYKSLGEALPREPCDETWRGDPELGSLPLTASASKFLASSFSAANCFSQRRSVRECSLHHIINSKAFKYTLCKSELGSKITNMYNALEKNNVNKAWIRYSTRVSFSLKRSWRALMAGLKLHRFKTR